MLKKLGIGELLRYALSGAIFVVTYASARYGWSINSAELFGTAERGIAVAVAAVLAGILTYALHRVVYRGITRLVLGYLRLRGLVDASFAAWRGFHRSEFRRDYVRWARQHNYPVFHEALQLWASHVHFLYCSAWAAAGGAFLGRWARRAGAQLNPAASASPGISPEQCFMAALGLACLCWLAAFIQNCSLTYADCRFCQHSGITDIPNLAGDLRPPLGAKEASDE